ncbi:Hypothetical predicted protein [Octopus vulgaris]|uniref:Uncharacterized protein n=1 Tax=Octopus vulgaris TaxID=6645 RepID=A0AA36AT51_OCTVU|nr:Hypothetical predicted protein [Octopus vulgaris]
MWGNRIGHERSKREKYLKIMEKFAVTLFLMILLCSRCEAHEVVPDGTIWLGESITLFISIPNMTRPIVWSVNNHRYECDRTCVDNCYYKVTQYNDTSTLWIANVTWENSKWRVEDKNPEFGEIDLDINVRPKIEIKNIGTEHIVMAKCSYPRTRIKCYYGQKPLPFTRESLSKCPDGRTFSSIGILSYPGLCGNVTCRFTIGKIFEEDRLLKFGMKPKTEITNRNCEYKMTARDSSPLTSIECFDRNKLLEFTNVRESHSSDGRTFSNILTLPLSDYSGNVTCNFTIGDIFRENRHFCVERKNPTPISYTVIIVFVVLFPLLFILRCFLSWIIMKTRKYGRDVSLLRKYFSFNPKSVFLALRTEVFAITSLVLYLNESQMNPVVLLVVSYVICNGIIIFIWFLSKKLIKEMERPQDGTETGETPKLFTHDMMQNKENGQLLKHGYVPVNYEGPSITLYEADSRPESSEENGQLLKHGYVPVNYEGPSIILDEEADSRPVSNEGSERESQPNENIPASIEGSERESQPNENIPASIEEREIESQPNENIAASIEGPFHGTCSTIITIH